MDQSPDERSGFTPEDLAILDARQQHAKSLWLSLLIAIAVSVGLWFVWRPLGATVGLITTGYLRKFFSHYADFWRQGVAMLVGVIVGICIAALVRFLTAYSGVTWVGAFWLGFLGIFGTGYIGYGTSHNAAYGPMNLDRNRATIGVFATISYVLAFAAILIFAWVKYA